MGRRDGATHDHSVSKSDKPERLTRGDLISAALAFAAVFLTIWPVAGQGLSLLDDGVWLTGAEHVYRGKVLYGEFFTIYGPAKFVVLAAFFAVAGMSAATLALVKSIALAVAAASGVLAARRMGARNAAVLVPVAVLALGILELKIVWAAVLSLVWGLLLRRGLDRRRAITMGCAWGTLAWFGLDAVITAGMVVVLSVLILHRVGRGDSVGLPALAVAAMAFAGVAVVPLVWAAASGCLSDFVWGTIVYPVMHFRAEMGVSLVDTLLFDNLIGNPFATLFTGEALGPQWPAHGALRALAVRALSGLVFIAPLAVLGLVRRGVRDPLLVAIGSYAVASLIPLTARGDESHLLGAGLGAAWLLGAAAARLPRPWAAAAIVMSLVSLGPFLAETIWLNLNRSRDTLAVWEHERAGIAIAASRVSQLEGNYGRLPGGAGVPTVFWPYHPGMNFLFDVPLAHRQITLLGGEVRDTQVLIKELHSELLPRIVLVRSFTLDGRTMRQLVPQLWVYLRTHYRIIGSFVDVHDPAWILSYEPEGWSSVSRLPLYERLPDKKQLTGNALSPDLSSGMSIMQSFPVDGVDLSGLRVQWLAGAGGFHVQIELVVWDAPNDHPEHPLHGYVIDVHFEERDHISLFSFGPVEGSAGRRVAVELRIREGAPYPVQLVWHSHDDSKDLFPEGRAFVNGKPVDADLYFLSY